MSESVSAMNERHAQEFNEHGRPVGHQYAEMRDLATVLERQNAELLAALQELVTTSDIDYEDLGETEFQAAADRHDTAMEQARAAIARALGWGEEMDWKPIASAPRDGKTYIQLWALNWERVANGVYSPRSALWDTELGCTDDGEPMHDDDLSPPTHWMPLPPPPETEK